MKLRSASASGPWHWNMMIMGIRRFLNADEIARGLSPLDPTLTAFRAGRLLVEEARALVVAGTDFGLESTLSGKTHQALLQSAKKRGYRIVLHYILLPSVSQAVARVSLRVMQGGHNVPEVDIRRRFERSRRHLLELYLPLADEWMLWDNSSPPHQLIADSTTYSHEEILPILESMRTQETTPREMSEMARLGLEASRIATAKMLDYYKLMGIEVTPQMTLAKPPPDPEGSARLRQGTASPSIDLEK